MIKDEGNIPVRFKGRDFVWIKEADGSGALAPPHHLEGGHITFKAAFGPEDSYAHVFEDGRILRYGKQIGTRDDLEFVAASAQDRRGNEMIEKREIKFTQYLMPFGTPTPVLIDRPTPIADLADAIVSKGYRLECEMLPTREISLTITNDDDGDVAIEVVPNGPEVPVAIDRMIQQFAASLTSTNGTKS